MEKWFVYTIAATIIYGVINFTYKVAAEHNLSSPKIVNRSATTISILSFAIILVTQSEFTNLQQLLLFAVINSTFFGLGSIVKIKALKYIPSSFVFPITKVNSAFLIIYALILFNEKPTATQWTGIFISFLILAYISINIKKEKTDVKDKKQQRLGLLFALLAAFSTSISMLAGKFASTEVPKLNFIFVSYTLVMLYTFVINKVVYRKVAKPSKLVRKKVLLFGVVIGILNFIGYFFVLSAFETGPLSLIQGISSNSFIIPIILSIIVFHEKFTYKNAIIVILAVFSILLIKL